MTAPLWTVDAIAAATGAERVGPLRQAVTGISIDSRTVKAGEAFFAIKGDAHDGHDFVAAALRQGAALAVVARNRRDGHGDDAPLMVVDDVLEALRQVARAARRRSAANILAGIPTGGQSAHHDGASRLPSPSRAGHPLAALLHNPPSRPL